LEARRAVRRRFREEKEEALDRYQEHLDRLDPEELDEEAQAELDTRIESIRDTKQDLQDRLQDLHDASDSEWESLRDAFEDAWSDFEDDWDDFSHYVESRIEIDEEEF